MSKGTIAKIYHCKKKKLYARNKSIARIIVEIFNWETSSVLIVRHLLIFSDGSWLGLQVRP